MASLTVRNLDQQVKTLLRLQAARHGWSMAQEAREILRRGVQDQPAGAGFAQRIHQRFAAAAIEELAVPKRRVARVPVLPKD